MGKSRGKQTNGYIVRQRERKTDRQTDGRTDGRTETKQKFYLNTVVGSLTIKYVQYCPICKPTDGRKDRWMDGWMDSHFAMKKENEAIFITIVSFQIS